MKTKGMNEAQFLSLLQKVLPKTTTDPHLVSAIYEGVAKELRLLKSIEAFEKLCETGALPNVEPDTVADLQSELAVEFGEQNVAITPDENGRGVEVEIVLPDRTDGGAKSFKHVLRIVRRKDRQERSDEKPEKAECP